MLVPTTIHFVSVDTWHVE